MATQVELEKVQQAVLRSTNPAEAAARAAAGATIDGYASELIEEAETSTIPALIVHAFVLGSAPSAARLDDLGPEARRQFEHYRSLGVLHPQLGPYEAFGRSLSGSPEFLARSSGRTDGEFVEACYGEVFGRAPTQAQAEHFQRQIDYFVERLAVEGSEPLPQAREQARAAVLGQMIGVAVIDPTERALHGYDRQATAFLKDAVAGRAAYGAPLAPLAS
jgi:hypothetical protein